MCKTFLLLAIFAFTALSAPFAADNSMINPEPAWRQGRQGRIFVPGVRIALPDGRRGIIETILPNGQLQTDLGLVLNPDGTLVEEPGSQAVVLEPPAAELGKADTPEAPVAPKADVEPEVVVEPKSRVAVPRPGAPEISPRETPLAEIPKVVVPDAAANPATPDKPRSLAEMIPLTPVPDKKPPVASEPEKKTQPKQEKKPKQEQKPKAKAEKKEPKQEKPAPKAKSGQELRIPEEAIKTGNLDFLEGCWQGTRPEYYSKRTIKECFCFGANGKNGKRRVIDPLGGRNCIGATSASLSGNGTLSVTSKGAACDDGERWGQAEMVCRNSGQRTPCSWVFRDANNGRQSYTIPFIKVDSCGR